MADQESLSNDDVQAALEQFVRTKAALDENNAAEDILRRRLPIESQNEMELYLARLREKVRADIDRTLATAIRKIPETIDNIVKQSVARLIGIRVDSWEPGKFRLETSDSPLFKEIQRLTTLCVMPIVRDAVNEAVPKLLQNKTLTKEIQRRTIEDAQYKFRTAYSEALEMIMTDAANEMARKVSAKMLQFVDGNVMESFDIQDPSSGDTEIGKLLLEIEARRLLEEEAERAAELQRLKDEEERQAQQQP